MSGEAFAASRIRQSHIEGCANQLPNRVKTVPSGQMNMSESPSPFPSFPLFPSFPPPLSWGLGCRVQVAGCRVQGAGCRAQGAGCRVNVDRGWGSNRHRRLFACRSVRQRTSQPRQDSAIRANEHVTLPLSPTGSHPQPSPFCAGEGGRVWGSR